jgi:hypothetical protein
MCGGAILLRPSRRLAAIVTHDCRMTRRRHDQYCSQMIQVQRLRELGLLILVGPGRERIHRAGIRRMKNRL